MKMRPAMDWLTERERVVLVHMMNGLDAPAIAAIEFISVCTVRTHIRNILQKLHVRSQLAAVATAYQTIWPEHQAGFQQVLEAS